MVKVWFLPYPIEIGVWEVKILSLCPLGSILGGWLGESKIDFFFQVSASESNVKVGLGFVGWRWRALARFRYNFCESHIMSFHFPWIFQNNVDGRWWHEWNYFFNLTSEWKILQRMKTLRLGHSALLILIRLLSNITIINLNYSATFDVRFIHLTQQKGVPGWYLISIQVIITKSHYTLNSNPNPTLSRSTCTYKDRRSAYYNKL